MRAAAIIQPLKEHQVMQPRHAQTVLQLQYHAQITSMGRIMAMACHAVICPDQKAGHTPWLEATNSARLSRNNSTDTLAQTQHTSI
jgi:hypothetical protein